MGRRKKEEAKAEPGAPLWMVTYSDMVTLLLCFFVMLLVYANFETPGKTEAAIQSINNAFGTGGLHQQKIEPPKPDKKSDMKEDSQQQNQKLVEALRSVLAEMNSQNFVRMTVTKTEIRVQLDDIFLFRPGSSKLNSGSLALLSDIAETLGGHPVTIVVEGHADTDGTSEEDNWKMSGARAVAVVTEMRRRKDEDGKPLIEGKYIEGRAMGQFHPSDIEKGQSRWNRRVELVIRGRNTTALDAIQKLDEKLGD